MTGPTAWALICVVFWIAAAVLTWRGSRKFRALYPQFRHGPFWAVLSYSTLFLIQPANSISRAVLGGWLGEESFVVYVAPGVLLLAVFFLIQAFIPATRRAVIAFNQHLTGKPVTGRLWPNGAPG
jgi:hypothetical protein